MIALSVYDWRAQIGSNACRLRRIGVAHITANLYTDIHLHIYFTATDYAVTQPQISVSHSSSVIGETVNVLP